jgi:hypothetical protein
MLLGMAGIIREHSVNGLTHQTLRRIGQVGLVRACTHCKKTVTRQCDGSLDSWVTVSIGETR